MVSPNTPIEYDVFEIYKLDKEVDIVVCGMDYEFTYSKLAIATLYVNEQKCKLIATNNDTFVNISGKRFPCAGALLASLLISV